MYSPPHYRELDSDRLRELMRANTFATLLTPGGPHISHLPLQLEEGDVLTGHMARANPHWRELEKTREALAIFQGPHAYISPAWYRPKPDNVPTWNYAVVHVRGQFEILDGAKARQAMDRMVRHFEAGYGTNWKLPQSEPEIGHLMRAIVVFRITDLKFDGKFKLSQAQDAADRDNVIQELERRSFGDLAELMKRL